MLTHSKISYISLLPQEDSVVKNSELKISWLSSIHTRFLISQSNLINYNCLSLLGVQLTYCIIVLIGMLMHCHLPSAYDSLSRFSIEILYLSCIIISECVNTPKSVFTWLSHVMREFVCMWWNGTTFPSLFILSHGCGNTTHQFWCVHENCHTWLSHSCKHYS